MKECCYGQSIPSINYGLDHFIIWNNAKCTVSVGFFGYREYGCCTIGLTVIYKTKYV